ncbi:MAG TPA: serine/threonine-protein kinase [Kofleriaceae bacterium]|nr:serine/threonine-protein kinase [Kofleriaceae bacterium]
MPEADQLRPRTGTRLRAEAPPGMQLVGEEGRKSIGRYEVVKTIGKGAMGVVYKARDPLLDRVVAVKTIMSPQQQGRRVRSAFLERFQREAKAAAKMSHPAIVTIFDVGVDEDTGAPFMVLEYLPGESLADRLDRVRIPLNKCVQIGLDLASALSFAHRQRIVHRDVKPANVLHAGDNRWKLADFGIARLPDSDLTQVGIFMGTPGYSPPEAIREGRYTPQADVFAWGAVMYELLSGRIPYEGPDTKTTNGYVVQGNAPSPTRHDPSIPEPLAAITMTALQPSATTRFKDGQDAEQALRQAWERCLTQGLVHPAVLAMEETSHDKAAVRFHEAKGVVARPSPQSLPSMGDSGEVTAIDAKSLGATAVVPPKSGKQLVVEAGRVRVGDDDPTMLVVRDDLKPKADATARGLGPTSGKPPAEKTDRKAVLKQDATPVTERQRGALDTEVDRAASPPVIGKAVAERNKGMGKGKWIVLAIVLLLAAGAVGLYYGGVLPL